ncbi:MAG: hypothetical protein Ct9H90mP16_13290 [Candidatus Poseidoniales archaeon]|nr:MAG: hypothetical protein Ct9H90mP16_13290 [Candidatus Poseidoniales archaeon]
MDYDGDGFEDLSAGGPWGPYDDCVYEHGTSVRDRIGCLDSDGDGWSDEGDEVDDNPPQWEDADGDGFGDNPSGTEWDACSDRPGNSTVIALGALTMRGMVGPMTMRMSLIAEFTRQWLPGFRWRRLGRWWQRW